MKSLLLKAGCEGKSIVFLFSDTQIADESFVEDINMILNTPDIPNLYQPDEKAEILEKMQAAARDTVNTKQNVSNKMFFFDNFVLGQKNRVNTTGFVQFLHRAC